MCVSTIGKWRFGASNLVLYSGFPLFGVSFNGGSTVVPYALKSLLEDCCYRLLISDMLLIVVFFLL